MLVVTLVVGVVLRRVMSSAPYQDIRVFRKLHGYKDKYKHRRNDVLYSQPRDKTDINSTLVYFGGDVQDYRSDMLAHRDNCRYMEWSLEATMHIMRERFPQHTCIIIHPARMHVKTFSGYDNFVLSDAIGSPIHEDNFNALRHLALLLLNIKQTLLKDDNGEVSSEENCTKDSPESEEDCEDSEDCAEDEVIDPVADLSSFGEVTLLGFSKGCVVLNQVIREIHYYSGDVDMFRWIKHMYWLDGAHSGGKDTWCTDTHVITSLANSGIHLHVHVTPYQIEDQNRPWICKEEKKFSSGLKKRNASLVREVHSEGEPPSLDNHFSLLRNFKSPE